MADSKRKNENSLAEEISAVGQRAVGAVKKAAGKVTSNEELEARGREENASGKARESANHVFGTFSDRESAEGAYNSLTQRGYQRDDVNLLMSDETRQRFFPENEDSEFHSKAMEGAGAGAAIGGAAIGILGAVIAVGTTVALPGLGLIIAGPLVAGLAGAGAGGIAGGLIGALIGWGIPEEHAHQYERDLRNGDIVMSVAPKHPEDANFVESEWKKYNGRTISR